MLIAIFASLIAISAGIAIYFRLKNNALMYAVFKPITTILIISLAVILNSEQSTLYGWTIISGLVLSLIGDVFLLKEKLFVYGLLAFLLAHICFTYAFISCFRFESGLLIPVILLLIGSVYFRFLLPHLKSYAIPVAVYFLAIIIMDWSALSISFSSGRDLIYLLGVGAVLFSFSDAVIAYNKFVKEFKFSELLILSTYWIAIFIFSVSIAFV